MNQTNQKSINETNLKNKLNYLLDQIYEVNESDADFLTIFTDLLPSMHTELICSKHFADSSQEVKRSLLEQYDNLKNITEQLLHLVNDYSGKIRIEDISSEYTPSKNIMKTRNKLSKT